MDGFKNSTKMKYMDGGMVGAYAKGGDVKPAMCKPAMGKMPMKKASGGDVKMPSAGESVKSGNRMSKMTAAEMRAMEARFGDKKRLPSAGESVKSGNRVGKQEAAEMRAMGLKKGGLAAMPKKGKC